jgi:predicted transcriptional regulator
MSRIPYELSQAIEGLDSPVRLRIVEALLDSTKLSYSEIRNLMALENNDLTYHLRILVKSGLVRQFAQESFERYRSYYDLSPFAWSLLQNMMRSLVPITLEPAFTSPGEPQLSPLLASGQVSKF